MIRRLLPLLAMILLAAIAVATGSWFTSGGRVYTVQTNSMQPTFRAGDAVLVRRISADELRVGQVITFKDRTSSSLIMSHRLIREFPVTTQGDANAVADLPLQPEQVIGKVVAMAPRLGSVLQWLRTPIGLVVAVYLPAAVAVVSVLLRVSTTPVYRLRR